MPCQVRRREILCPRSPSACATFPRPARVIFRRARRVSAEFQSENRSAGESLRHNFLPARNANSSSNNRAPPQICTARRSSARRREKFSDTRGRSTCRITRGVKQGVAVDGVTKFIVAQIFGADNFVAEHRPNLRVVVEKIFLQQRNNLVAEGGGNVGD